MQIKSYVVFPVYSIQYSMDSKKQKKEQQKKNDKNKKEFSKTLLESSSTFCRNC